ncbi:MAG: hypothetical protein U0228_20790 [Myxococcaceae bacterium]
MAGETTSSTLLLDELLDAGDVRLLEELLKSKAQKKLPAIAERLVSDPRPYARPTLLGYLADGCDRPGHRVFVKSVFKWAEKHGDIELMAHFAAAFDRLVKRELVTQSRWDWTSRQMVTEKVLREPFDILKRLPRFKRGKRTYTNPLTGTVTNVRRPHVPLIRPRTRWERNPRTGRWETVREGGGGEGVDPLRFSFSTRRYLQRRTWRYFRTFARESASAYRERVMQVLPLFRDEHLATVEALLDGWFLVHALYGKSEVLDRKPLGVVVASGKSLADLAYAPYCPQAWQETAAGEALLKLLTSARSRPVRRFAAWALEQHHRSLLETLPVSRLVVLLKSPHAEVQAVAAKLLDGAKGMESLPIGDWLELLTVPSLEVLVAVCAAVKKHVLPSRLSLEQCVQLACARAAPVSELGLEWAKARPPKNAAELEQLLALRHAECQQTRVAAMEWLAQQLLIRDDARPLFVRELLDARYVEVRKAAVELMGKDKRFGDAVELWLAMSETPWADVREHFLGQFEAREKAFPAETLQRVWATTLLAPHRGNRARRQAVRQVADRLVKAKEERAALVRLLGFTLRSVRETERRAALSQLVRAASEEPELQALLAAELPELVIDGKGAAE